LLRAIDAGVTPARRDVMQSEEALFTEETSVREKSATEQDVRCDRDLIRRDRVRA
jgi:hypothetical protein